MNESIIDSIMGGGRTKNEKKGMNGKSRNGVRFSGPHHRVFQLDGGGNGGAPAPLK